MARTALSGGFSQGTSLGPIGTADTNTTRIRVDLVAPGTAESDQLLGAGNVFLQMTPAQASTAQSATENNVKRTAHSAFTITAVNLRLGTNANGSTMTATVRKNNANTAMTATIPLNASGVVALSGGPVSIAAGDTYDLLIAMGALQLNVRGLEVVISG